MVRGRGRAAILASQVRSRGAALRGSATRGVNVNVASATSIDEALLGGSQSSFASTASRSRISLLFVNAGDVGVEEVILSSVSKMSFVNEAP